MVCVFGNFPQKKSANQRKFGHPLPANENRKNSAFPISFPKINENLKRRVREEFFISQMALLTGSSCSK